MQTNPQQAAANWAAAMQSAGQKATAGANAVTVAPTELAAQAVDRQVLGVQQAASSGKTASRLRAVSLSSWQKSYVSKGVPRMGTGATAALPKMQAFMTQFLPVLAGNVAALPPRGTTEQNIQRAVQLMRANSTFSYQPPNS